MDLLKKAQLSQKKMVKGIQEEQVLDVIETMKVIE